MDGLNIAYTYKRKSNQQNNYYSCCILRSTFCLITSPSEGGLTKQREIEGRFLHDRLEEHGTWGYIERPEAYHVCDEVWCGCIELTSRLIVPPSLPCPVLHRAKNYFVFHVLNDTTTATR